MSKLTPWYPPEIKPVRKGVYHASTMKNPGIYRYWNGKAWSFFGHFPADVPKNKIAASQDMCWRGLARKPK